MFFGSPTVKQGGSSSPALGPGPSSTTIQPPAPPDATAAASVGAAAANAAAAAQRKRAAAGGDSAPLTGTPGAKTPGATLAPKSLLGS